MNSQLQCLYHIPYVREIILGNCEASSSAASAALMGLHSVFNSMKRASVQGNGDISLTPAVPTLPLCHSIGINVYEQQDSQEFWKLLLPELKLAALTNLYKGHYENYIVALDKSGRERKRIETFVDLSLDVINARSLKESIENMFTKAEVLSVKEGNGWRPEKGAEKVDALKGISLRINDLPTILQFHLMRFSFNWETETMSKVNDRFTFPKVLDLSNFCKEKEQCDSSRAIYELQSVVVHAGEYGSGHYYSYIRPDIHRNLWYRYDDSRVTLVTFKEVVEDAYGQVQQKLGLRERILSRFSGFGWGGKSTSAYLLQYVRRSDVPFLFGK